MALYGSASIQDDLNPAPSSEAQLLGESAKLQESTEAPAEPEVGSKTYLLVFVLVLLNSVLLGAIACIGWGMYRDMQTVAQPFLALTSGGGGASRGPLGVAARRGSVAAGGARSLVEERLEDTLSAATTFFLFGDADSAVAAFVSNLLRFDFQSFGAAAQQFGSKLASTFNVSCNQARVFCNTTSPYPYYNTQMLKCPPRPGRPEGSTVYCSQYPASWGYSQYYPSYWSNCGLGCPYAALETVGGAISSVAAVVKQVVLPASVQQVSVGPASFSTGVFRLDGLLQWVQSQFNLGPWAAAGTTCAAFFTQLQAQNWTNCFTSTASCGGYNNLTNCASTTCWDIRRGGLEFFNRSAELCNLMATLSS